MKMNRHTGFALLLIFFGGLILLNKLGLQHGHFFGSLFGHLIGILFSAALIGLGALGLKNGKRVIGLILVVIGGCSLLGQLSGLIAIAVAIGLILYGVSMFRNRSVH
ncbi:LiaF transmembrane domain-containing protein [Paenibacillus cremeus]|uniref:LiaF transmembrane domain-containing protein n=1 Tax=Paenibacillus cremeus TaxID=2163881 RepID=A0A559K066_9BACL|nr:hypothetical protein [Paenibacillus cremeus]TVY05545.1 hypothetical protein FPZ49_29620 [Paenibacillus cremeus]